MNEVQGTDEPELFDSPLAIQRQSEELAGQSLLDCFAMYAGVIRAGFLLMKYLECPRIDFNLFRNLINRLQLEHTTRAVTKSSQWGPIWTPSELYQSKWTSNLFETMSDRSVSNHLRLGSSSDRGVLHIWGRVVLQNDVSTGVVRIIQ